MSPSGTENRKFSQEKSIRSGKQWFFCLFYKTDLLTVIYTYKAFLAFLLYSHWDSTIPWSKYMILKKQTKQLYQRDALASAHGWPCPSQFETSKYPRAKKKKRVEIMQTFLKPTRDILWQDFDRWNCSGLKIIQGNRLSLSFFRGKFNIAILLFPLLRLAHFHAYV